MKQKRSGKKSFFFFFSFFLFFEIYLIDTYIHNGLSMYILMYVGLFSF